jgi:hypothetical protein
MLRPQGNKGKFMSSGNRSRVRRAVLQAAVVGALGLCAGQAYAVCTFGGSGEPSLQGSLNSLLGSGVVDAGTSCVNDGSDAAWATVGTTGSASILIELAGNASSNTFGVYDLNNPLNRLSIFEGNDTVDSFAVVRLAPLANGAWNLSVRERNNPDDPSGWTQMTVASPAFGFYLGTASQGTFFSNTNLNTDGLDHMYAYEGANTTFQGGPLAGEVFALQDYILAWEDLRVPGSDRDYQDFVAVVQDIAPVPLPTAIWLLASGLIGLTGVGRRRA